MSNLSRYDSHAIGSDGFLTALSFIAGIFTACALAGVL